MPRSPSTSERKQGVPLPLSLTLYNLYVPNESQHISDNNKNKKTLFRPEYTCDLLLPVRLDVVFSSNNTEETDQDIMLYSSNNTLGSIHPSWDHLDEKIEALNETGRDSIYQNVKCKLVASRHDANEEVVLAEVPLHPSRLRRLPEEVSNTTKDDTLTWETRSPPKQLPPNAVLVHFSDGSTRVCPPLYHFLVERQVIIETNPRDASLIQDQEEEHRRQLRFDDNVFDALDQAVWWQETRQNNKNRPSPFSLLETDDESKAVVIKSLGNDMNDMSQEFTTSLVLSGDTSQDDGETDSNAMTKLTMMHPQSFLPVETESVIFDLEREKEELELLLEQEEACLQEELAALHEVRLHTSLVVVVVVVVLLAFHRVALGKPPHNTL